MKVGVKKLDPVSKIPQYATDGAACFDIAALDAGTVVAGGAHQFRTGLAFEIPEDHVMLIFSRSGHGFKSGVRLSNCVGVIDSDYRGELCVKLQSDQTYIGVKEGDRIAQGMVIKYDRVQFEEVSELSSTDRGTGGFGSTGVA